MLKTISTLIKILIPRAFIGTALQTGSTRNAAYIHKRSSILCLLSRIRLLAYLWCIYIYMYGYVYVPDLYQPEEINLVQLIGSSCIHLASYSRDHVSPRARELSHICCCCVRVCVCTRVHKFRLDENFCASFARARARDREVSLLRADILAPVQQAFFDRALGT